MKKIEVMEDELPVELVLIGKGRNSGKRKTYVIGRSRKTFGIFMNVIERCLNRLFGRSE